MCFQAVRAKYFLISPFLGVLDSLDLVAVEPRKVPVVDLLKKGGLVAALHPDIV